MVILENHANLAAQKRNFTVFQTRDVMAAKPAPVIPAINACDSLEGIPKAQAITPQVITPIIPALKAFKAIS